MNSDVAKLVEEMHRRADRLAEGCGLVEFEVVAGEEPEEGVEVEMSDRGCCACDLAEGHDGEHTVWLRRS